MGHDYSYSLPSSSDENDKLAFILDEAESSYSQPVQYPPQPECDDGIPQICAYCCYVFHLKFSLEHAWRELRHDKKWCSSIVAKDTVKDKRKQVLEVDGEEAEGRPVGVKAAKAASKRKKSGKEEELSKLQSLMEIKEKLNKQKLLNSLLAKKEPLSEMETSLKLKLMADMI